MDLAIDSYLADLNNASSLDKLSEVSKAVTGEKGVLTLASKEIGKLEPSQRAEAGKKLSACKKLWDESFQKKLAILESEALSRQIENEKIDFTLPAEINELGARHPIQVLQENIADFFISLGWQVDSGPEIEATWFNFDALNFGVDHPARQMQDTFYGVQENTVLRTHTSPVQARSLIQNGVPLYIACPGKVFRTDELDATHTPVFHQCEGLAVDKGLTMADLKGVIDHFAKAMFGKNAKTRLRPSYFPFTEPSAEMDVWFEGKRGGAGWIEWGGCGMVNPNVLKACGVDPEIYTGFAFGMGIERTLMLRHDIDDMHDIVEGDIRFSKQFGI